MAFLRNRWYASLWASELGKNPVGRKILGEDIVFFRTASGVVSALSSLCPHRFAPLEYGTVVGDNLKCRYHGLQFGTDGVCKVDPSGAKPPPMKTKKFDVVEKHGMIYIWIGDAQPESEAPDWLDFGPGYGGVLRGELKVNANFQFMVDNLMDDAHATHLHELLETSGHVARPKLEIIDAGDRLHANTDILNTEQNQLFRALYRRPGNVDQLIRLTWNAPATVNVRAGVCAIGGKFDEQIGVNSAHMVTPETATTSHYFWSFARNSVLEDHAFTEKMSQMLRKIFTTEDVWMVEAQQRALGSDNFWERKPALMPQDRAAASVRRKIDKLIADQQATSVAAQ